MAMVKNPFNGNLNSNEIFASIYNMIISQEVFADNISGTYSDLVNMVKTDGSLYGDTKLYYATDALKSHPWTNDSEAQNLLALDRPADPKCQAITLDQFRQIRLTVDNYLSKRAWADEGAFSSFNSVMLGWIYETKKIYDATLVNTYIGTVTTLATANSVSVDITTATTGLTGVEADQKEAMEIAREMADLFVDMQDISRDYNDYGFLRSYSVSDLVVVWNSAYANKIRKVDLPTIFHKDGLVDKFDEYRLPSRYFGTVNSGTGTTGSSNATVRSLIETDYGSTHVFPGDLLPDSTQYAAGTTYTVDSTIICKVMHRSSIKYMSAFEVGTSFFNPRSLTETHYLTFGYSSPDYLRNYPIVTVSAI